MLNLCEMGLPADGCRARLEELAALLMRAAGVREYALQSEDSVLYGQTVDLVAGDLELGSAAIGPHELDRPWKINEPWVGIGLGLERPGHGGEGGDSLARWGAASRTWTAARRGCRMRGLGHQRDPRLEPILQRALHTALRRELETVRSGRRTWARRRAEERAAFRAAREPGRRHFGDRVFLYGFLPSTFCRNDCRFCWYRRSNPACRRYRDEMETLEAAVRLAGSGVHLLDLTLSEDPVLRAEGFAVLAHLTARVKEVTGLPLMLSPGVAPAETLLRLKRAGADWYACYQETHSRGLFRRLRPQQSFGARMGAKRAARRAGLLLEEGILCGVGESPRDLARSVKAMGLLGAAQVRAMSFVPHAGIPLPRIPGAGGDPRGGDPQRELVAIAVLRLAFPDRLIPASLDVDGLAGLERRLAAGANVVSSLIPPGQGLAGVAQSELDIEEGRSTAAEVGEVLRRCGLAPASRAEYAEWLARRKAGAAGSASASDAGSAAGAASAAEAPCG
jgi:methylornithine synthase